MEVYFHQQYFVILKYVRIRTINEELIFELSFIIVIAKKK